MTSILSAQMCRKRMACDLMDRNKQWNEMVRDFYTIHTSADIQFWMSWERKNASREKALNSLEDRVYRRCLIHRKHLNIAAYTADMTTETQNFEKRITYFLKIKAIYTCCFSEINEYQRTWPIQNQLHASPPTITIDNIIQLSAMLLVIKRPDVVPTRQDWETLAEIELFIQSSFYRDNVGNNAFGRTGIYPSATILDIPSDTTTTMPVALSLATAPEPAISVEAPSTIAVTPIETLIANTPTDTPEVTDATLAPPNTLLHRPAARSASQPRKITSRSVRPALFHRLVVQVDVECCICLESLDHNCIAATLPCGHMIHKLCCEELCLSVKKCPLCRRKFIECSHK